MFILVQLLSFFVGTKSVRRQLQRDIKHLDRLMGEFKEGLIPFEEDEFKLLSSQPVLKKNRKSRSTFSRGVLSTIYQEPLIAFSLKENYRDDSVLLLAQSDKNKFQLNFNGKNTEVYVDGQNLGYINSNHEFINPQNQRIAGIEHSEGEKYAKVFLNNKDTAHINIRESNNESERVFSLFHDFKHEDSDEMVLLTLYYLFIERKAA